MTSLADFATGRSLPMTLALPLMRCVYQASANIQIYFQYKFISILCGLAYIDQCINRYIYSECLTV